MTLPMLRGIGDSVAENLPGLADAVNDIVNPNAKFNAAMRALFVQKPELMQKFVDIEKANPGTLAAFGFNQRGTDLLSGMQESVEGLRSRVSRPATEAALGDPANLAAIGEEQATGHTSGANAQNRFQTLMANGGSELAARDPQAFYEMIQHEFGVQGETARTLDARQQQALQAVDSTVDFGGGRKMKLTEMGLPEWREAVRLGILNNEQFSGALEDPRTHGYAKMALDDQRSQREYALRSQYGAQDAQEMERLRRAGLMFDASGQVGSIDAWYQLANPGRRVPGSNYVVSDAERKSVEDASKNERMRTRLGTIRNIDSTRKQAKLDIANASTTEERDAAIARYNETLPATDPDIEAYWLDTPWLSGGSDRLAFRNRATKAAVEAPPEIPTNDVPTSTDPRVVTAITRLRGLRKQKKEAQVQQELQQLKSQNADLGAQVEAGLGSSTE